MVSALTGTLLKCDPPTMEIVKQINESKHFIIEQIDEGVALCKDSVTQFLKEEVTRRLEIAECYIPPNEQK
ncbi:Transcription factor TFIIH complex subunit Tfb5 family protein [Theileria parva strain Muguga]|nr:Transcription factor TFIIH complex subunit Tfb5 family protein [Theileria parva strain Muguga]EAN30850.2 Transcription factor TFIIH complex subunit Tfb5 family protein [Theileria parva strain Muguga]